MDSGRLWDSYINENVKITVNTDDTYATSVFLDVGRFMILEMLMGGEGTSPVTSVQLGAGVLGNNISAADTALLLPITVTPAMTPARDAKTIEFTTSMQVTNLFAMTELLLLNLENKPVAKCILKTPITLSSGDNLAINWYLAF